MDHAVTGNPLKKGVLETWQRLQTFWSSWFRDTTKWETPAKQESQIRKLEPTGLRSGSTASGGCPGKFSYLPKCPSPQMIMKICDSNSLNMFMMWIYLPMNDFTVLWLLIYGYLLTSIPILLKQVAVQRMSIHARTSSVYS